MSSRFRAFVAKVKTQFDIVHGYVASPESGENVPFAVGVLEKNASSDKPRVEVVHVGGSFSRRLEQGPGDDEDDAEREEFGSILTKQSEIEVACWGADEEDAETIMDHVLLAASRANVPVTFKSYQFLTEHHGDAGAIFLLRGTAEIQVPADTEHTVQLLPLESFEQHVTAKGVTVDAEYPEP